MPRARAADLYERDPDYIRESLPPVWPLASFYFRSDIEGLQHIPAEGPVLLVGNHSGGNSPPDTFIFTLAFTAWFGVERRFYQLAHHLVLRLPGLGFLRKYGTIEASQENAERALRSGAAVLVYPQRDEALAAAEVALRLKVPIVPVVAIGGQETALFLSRGEGLARALGLDRLVRLKVLPLSIAPPWGLNVGDMLGHFWAAGQDHHPRPGTPRAGQRRDGGRGL